MKTLSLIAITSLFLSSNFNSYSQNNEASIKNIETFAKLYGYVRYFHPSDEASKINWEKFAIYGIQKVEKAKDADELQAALKEIFLPVAPSILIYRTNEKIIFSVSSITPENLKNTKIISWQHLGYGIGNNKDTYKSLRLNRKDTLLGTDSLDYLFETKTKIGEYFSKDIGSGLNCIVPLALYGDGKNTYPSNQKVFEKFVSDIETNIPDKLSANNLYVRLADVVMSWNVFEHFYPYFDVVKTDWKKTLKPALGKAYNDKNEIEFKQTLEKLVSELYDGHGRVLLKGDTTIGFMPLMNWAWIENQLVITDIFDKGIDLQKGDVVIEINDKAAAKAIEDNEQYISAATPQLKTYRNLLFILWGGKNTEMNLKIKRNETEIRDAKVVRTILYKQYKKKYEDTNPDFRKINETTWYLNISKIPMEKIDSLMPQLEKANSIICDLRGYPNGNTDFLRHLISKADTLKEASPPQIIYPDFENIIYKKDTAASFLTPLLPKINAKIIFIIDGRVISWGESYMMFVEHYKLATIIGQPTGGTNGVINSFDLPGGYTVISTGMRILKGNGKQHHGVGVIPTVIVNRTIKGIKEGHDEFLEKALEIAQ